MNPALAEMVRLTSSHNLDYGIISNAYEYMAYFPIIQQDRAHFRGFHFSLDGIEEIHDDIRTTGSFKQVLEAVRFYNLIGVNVIINHVLNGLSYESFESFLELCKENGMTQIKLGGILDSGVNKNLLLSTSQRVDIFGRIPTLRKKYGLRIDISNSLYNDSQLDFCPVITQTNFTFNPKGEFLFCCDIPGVKARLGDVSEDGKHLIKKRLDFSHQIRLDRLEKTTSNSLCERDQYCAYCHCYFKMNG